MADNQCETCGGWTHRRPEHQQDLPAELDVFRVALKEIDYVVGNESHLDETACAYLRGILSAALNEGFSLRSTRMRAEPEPVLEWLRRRSEDRGDL